MSLELELFCVLDPTVAIPLLETVSCPNELREKNNNANRVILFFIAFLIFAISLQK
jgi:hypothetical protein